MHITTQKIIVFSLSHRTLYEAFTGNASNESSLNLLFHQRKEASVFHYQPKIQMNGWHYLQ